MQVDIALKNARIYNVEKLDVIVNEQFSIETDYTGKSRWFSDEDQVLQLRVTDNNAEVFASTVGISSILIMNESMEIIKALNIRVVDAIKPIATKLEVTAGTPEPK